MYKNSTFDFPMYTYTFMRLPKAKPLVFSEADNVSCTAALEVELDKFISSLKRHSKENTKRSSALEKEKGKAKYWKEHKQDELSSYYFSGKASAYTYVAEKLREILDKNQFS